MAPPRPPRPWKERAGGGEPRRRPPRGVEEAGEPGGRSPPAPPSLLWAIRHRPATLDAIAGQEAAVALLKRIAAEGDLPHLVLYGPPGTGKRSAALALARGLFGEGWEGATTLLDLSGESRATARDLLGRIAREAGMRPVGRRFRLLILDGCEAMTPWAQQGLRRVMERLSGGSRFLLLTSRLGRLVPALRSRLLPVPFHSLGDEALGREVDRVARSEGVLFSGSGRQVLLFHARGSPERALHILQAAHLASGGRPLDAAEVERAAQGWESDLGPLLRASPADARGLLDRLLSRGVPPETIVERFASHIAASPIPEEEKAAWAVALAEVEGRLREGLRARTQLQGLGKPPVTPRPAEPAASPSVPGGRGTPPRALRSR